MKNFFYFVTISIVIFYSSLNAQWVHLSGGLENKIVSELAYDQQTLYAGSDSLFISTDQGISWLRPDSTILAVNAFAFGDELDVFAGTGGFGIYRSTNGGLNWAPVNSGLTNTYVGSLASTDTNLFAGTEGGVFLSTNNGSLWVEVNSGLTNQIILSLSANPLNVFAGSYGGGVFVSSNNGSTWSSANSGLTYPIVNTLALAGETVFAGTPSRGVFRTTDNGSNWTQINFGLTDTSINTISIIGMNIFTSTQGGVFLSSNNGDSWLNVSSGLPNNYPVLGFAFDSTFIYAGLYYGGVWRRPLSEMITGIDEHGGEIPYQFILTQNFPNPFNPSTKIKYSIPQSSNVMIKVFDILGNEIETLVNEEKTVGTYEITWYAANLPSGIYFYTINAGSFIETKKLVLLK